MDGMADMEQIKELYTTAPLTFVDIITQKVTYTNSVRTIFTNDRLSGLVFPLKGTAQFSIDGLTYEIEQGSILHVGPNMEMKRTVANDEIFEYAVIHFELSGESANRFPIFKEHFMLQVGDSMKLNNRVQQLMQNFLIPGGLAFLQSKRLFLTVLEEMIVASEKTHSEKAESMDAIIQYMHQFFPKAITVLNVAKHFQVDRRRLTSLFERQMGVTPNMYLTDLRIQHAKLLLRTSNLSVAHIAERIGYKDHFYFSRVFKKETGLSPTVYRRHLG